jgi:hypothetical protein
VFQTKPVWGLGVESRDLEPGRVVVLRLLGGVRWRSLHVLPVLLGHAILRVTNIARTVSPCRTSRHSVLRVAYGMKHKSGTITPLMR